MALFDIFALVVIVACVFMSMMRGVIDEVASLLTWIIAFVAAKMFAEPFADIAFSSIEPRAFALALSFVAVFMMAWAVQRFLRSLLTSVISAIGLGGINRLLGAAFGAFKGVVVVMLVVMVGSATDLPRHEGWAQSVSAPYFQVLAETVIPHLREAWSVNSQESMPDEATDAAVEM